MIFISKIKNIVTINSEEVEIRTKLTFEQSWCPYDTETTENAKQLFVGCDGRSLWKQIPEHPNYYVSTTGYVCTEKVYYFLKKEQRNHFKKYLRQEDNGRKRMRVRLDGYRYQVAHLVAVAFIPNPLNKPYIHHIDGNCKNNNVNNLIWVTELEHKLFHKKNRTADEQAIIDKLLEERRALPI